MTSMPMPTWKPLQQLADLGVTWCAAPIPADSLNRAVDALHRYGESVIRV